jgi:hypothetical protein
MDANQLAELKQLIPDELVTEVSAGFKADPGFREAFLSDPKDAYRRRFGKELLPGEEITVEARADGTKCLYLSRLDARFVVAAGVNPELSDEELGFAVGGQDQDTNFGKKFPMPPRPRP